MTEATTKQGKPLFQPFSWLDKKSPTDLSGGDLSMYRDIVTGCRMMADIIFLDTLEKADNRQPFFSEYDMLDAMLFLRSTLGMLQERLQNETDTYVLNGRKEGKQP